MQSAQNPFEMLGIAARYELSANELKEIEKNYREKSRQVHPDRAAPEHRLDFASKAAALNEAFRVVKDPVKRAEAMFALHGVKTGETVEPKPSPEFLMSMLEHREELADAKAIKDLEAVQALAKVMLAQEEEVHRALASAFTSEKLDENAARATAAVAKLGELRFFARFREEVRLIEDELLEG